MAVGTNLDSSTGFCCWQGCCTVLGIGAVGMKFLGQLSCFFMGLTSDFTFG